MRRFILLLVLVLGFATTARAQTLKVGDILELTKAGLNEQALLALIEVHKSIFPIDRDTLKMLKAEGVNDNVIVAMIRSGRDTIVPPEPPVPTPSVIVDRGDGTQPLIIKDRAPVDTRVVVVEQPPAPRQAERRVVEERVVQVPVPVYVPVVTRPRDPSDRPNPPKKVEPVYWGFDGKLRPDAWKPGGGDSKKNN